MELSSPFSVLFLTNCLYKYLYSFFIYYDLYIYIKSLVFLNKVLFFLKKNSLFCVNMLIDICVVDYPMRIQRFEFSYNLISLMFNRRFICKVLAYDSVFVNSIGDLYKSAFWVEREIWDMFGIFFIGHPDLRRILTDYGFEGYPLRKDFPLTGFVELQYDEEILALKYVPVELMQDYRIFVFSSPWEIKEI